MTRRKGISLIVLVITIIVIIIIAGAIVISLTENNIIDKAKKAKFKNDLKNLESEYSMWTSGIQSNNHTINLSEVYATKDEISGLESSSEIKNITDILPSLKKNTIYSDKVVILGGKIKTKDINLTIEELENAIDMGISSSNSYVSTGLILHYDSINNTGVGHNPVTTTWKDLSGNGIEGNKVNFNNNSASGFTSNGLVFDGQNDYVTAGNSGSIGIENYLSITAWVKFGNVADNVRVGNIIGKYNHIPHFNFEGHTSGRLRFYWNGGQIDFFGTKDLRGVWHNVAVVRNKLDDTIKLYIDGVLDAQRTAGTNISPSWPLKIGDDYRNNNLPAIPFNGHIGSILVYNKALTENEIKQNYKIDKSRFGV